MDNENASKTRGAPSSTHPAPARTVTQASTMPAASEAVAGNGPFEPGHDARDIADLWREALQNFEGIAGFDLERKFDNVQDMVAFANTQIDSFHTFRHDKKKVDRLRTIFKSNLDLLETGTQQLLAAATPAFPPAAAIGTALTFVLQTCRSQSADYDIVVIFLDDMNSFLQRIAILEARCPRHKSYQNCLMDVFSSLLSMCGFAHKLIVLGRFKKWLVNLVQGQDAELAGARKSLDTHLTRLQNATEYAILGNTEETKMMAEELRQNSEQHSSMLHEQRNMLSSMQQTAESTQNDVQKILKFLTMQGLDKKMANTPPTAGDASPLANRVRSTMHTVEADSHEYEVLREIQVPNTCAWLFNEPDWIAWENQAAAKRPILFISGPAGSGKSHLALAVHERLKASAPEGSAGETAVAHFYFREQQPNFKYFLCGIITVINQIAEQNARLCEKINNQFTIDELEIDPGLWQSLVQHVLVPLFHHETKAELLLVLDGLDELFDFWSFPEFAQMITTETLNISVVVTCRDGHLPSLMAEEFPALVIEVSKEKQLIDFNAIVWHRIKRLHNLRNFSTYVQARIAERTVEMSPNLLYLERTLARLDNLGLEGAVLQSLNQAMPCSLDEMYDMLLEECQRRMPATHQQVVSMLLHWMAFSRRDMMLAEVQSLLKFFSGSDAFSLAEIPEILSKFLRIGDPVELLARKTSQAASYQVSDLGTGQYEEIYDDGKLPVKFQERSMLHFFRELQGEDKPFRWRASEAHRRMFLACVDIMDRKHENSSRTPHLELQNYAADEFLTHWYQIQVETHSAAQQIEVMEGLAKIMSRESRLAELLSRLPGLYYTGTEDVTELVDDKLVDWTGLLSLAEVKSLLSTTTLQWWVGLANDPRRLRLGVAQGFMELLYRASDIDGARKQFALVKNVLHVCQLHELLVTNARKWYPERVLEADDKEPRDATLALGIVHLFEEIPMDDCAYRATAEVLSDYYIDVAEDLCLKALEHNQTNGSVAERCKIWTRLSNIRLSAKNFAGSRKAIETGLRCSQHDNAVPVTIQHELWHTKALIEGALGNHGEAALCYREARAADPTTMVPGAALVRELAAYRIMDDKKAYLATLKTWTPLERLTWLVWDYSTEGDIRHAYFCDCAASLGEVDFIVSVYQETVRLLDNVGASAPLKLDLALVYLQVAGDSAVALQTVEEVFDMTTNGRLWPITEENPQNTLERALNIMSDACFARFHKSRDPKTKAEYLHKMKGVLQRKFAVSAPVYSPLVMINYEMTLAMMSLKMRNAMDFHSILQSAMDTCFLTLGDKVSWNDGRSLLELGRALALLAKAIPHAQMSERLYKYARTTASAMFSRLDSEMDDEVSHQLAVATAERLNMRLEAEGTLPLPAREQHQDSEDLLPHAIATFICDGACIPRMEWTWWKDRPAYCCLTCSVTLLCAACYANRPTTCQGELPQSARSYCGSRHEYMTLPVEGWIGIKSGHVVMDGEPPIPVETFFQGLKDAVNEAWGEFWNGA
ncbi:hypothetical protein NLG97_g7910 [Lecanicillium saksenae]|uniref:Uncharacterized protein n=1 Tax=Lecanicillium saksenae TaxID=468837 RepID=A0ACC1QKI7_9HYPO|nr:hypothetical protein NLG97_g7910 [Lecanicillium saksenae]